MKHVHSLLITSLALIAAPAFGAVTVLGSSSARMCYEAAESNNGNGTSLRFCDRALGEEALSEHDRVATFVNRGILKMQRGNLDGAIVDFDTAIAENGEQAEAYLNKGVAMLRRPAGWDEAVPLFTAAIEKNTLKPEIAYLGRGIAHEMGGKVKDAYRDYKQASVLAPKWNEPAVQLARFTVVRN